jgi:hypothetical protein
MKGPGPESTDNHRSLVGRLAAICDAQGVEYGERLIVGETPYKLPFKVDLALRGLPTYPDGLGVVARTQESTGSADQKLIFLAFSIRRSTLPCVVILDGGGWPDGAIDWLTGQIAGNFVALLSVEEFAAFVRQQQPNAV